MIDDFTPIVHRLPGRTIRVWAVADVHIGSKECDLDGFEKFLKKVASEQDSYIALCGDLINNGIKDSLTSVYDETVSPQAQIEKAVDLLTPVAGKILGAVGGNHEHRTKRAVDVDVMNYIMCLLKIPELYRQNMAFIRVNLEKGTTKDHYALMLTHGKTANKKKQFVGVVEGVDAVITAHTHTPDVLMPARIRFNTSNKVTVHNVISLTACSWLQPGGYSLAGLYLPQTTSRPQCLELPFVNSNDIRGVPRVIW